MFDAKVCVEAVAVAILHDLEDRKGIKQQFCSIKDEDPEIYDEIKMAIGHAAVLEVLRQLEETLIRDINQFQDMIGWQKGESRNALVLEICDSVREQFEEARRQVEALDG